MEPGSRLHSKPDGRRNVFLVDVAVESIIQYADIPHSGEGFRTGFRCSPKKGGQALSAKKIEELFKKARDSIQRKNYNLAIFTYIMILRMDPAHIEAREQLRASQERRAKEKGTSGFGTLKAMLAANLKKTLGKTDDAIIACENGLTADPKHLGLNMLLAQLLEKKDAIEAAAAQRQAIADRVAPENTANLYALAKLFESLKRAAESISIYERIRSVNPKADIDPEIRRVSAELTSETYQMAAKEGARKILKDDNEAEALELDAGRLRTDDQRMKAIRYRQEHDLAERPKDYAIWVTIGDIAFTMEDWTQGYAMAKEFYEKAQELNPANSAIRDKIGNLEMKNNRVRLDALQEKAKGGDAKAKAAFQSLRKKDLEFQRIEYERRVKDQPMKAEFHFKLGNILMQYKRYDEAIGELQAAAKDPKFRVKALTNMGRCLMETDQIEMAISQFERAREGVELFDRYRETMYFEATAYEKLGDPDSLQKALKLFTELYEADINYKDVKTKVPGLRKQLKGG